MTYDIYRYIFVGGAGLAGLSLIIAVILFFLFLIQTDAFLFKVNKVTERNIELCAVGDELHGGVVVVGIDHSDLGRGRELLEEDGGLLGEGILFSGCDEQLCLLGRRDVHLGAAVADAANRLRPKLGDGFGTFVALVRALWRARGYAVTLNGETLESRLHVLVTRIPLIAGGLRLALPKLGKDEFAVWSVRQPRLWALPNLIWRLYRGKPCGEFRVFREPVRITAADALAMEFDGDPHGELPVEIRFADRKLKLVCP